MREKPPLLCEGKLQKSNLLEFFDHVNKVVDKGEPGDIIYLDFQKAFDKAPHNRLLRKLSDRRGKVLSWIINWLKHRK